MEPGRRALRGEFNLPTELYGAAKATGTVGALRYGVLGRSRGGRRISRSRRRRQSGRPSTPTAAISRRRACSTSTSRRHATRSVTSVPRRQGPLYDAYVHGVDGKFTSATGKWIAEALLIQTDRDDVEGNAAQLDLQYARDSRIQHRLSLDWFDETVKLSTTSASCSATTTAAAQ